MKLGKLIIEAFFDLGVAMIMMLIFFYAVIYTAFELSYKWLKRKIL